MNFRFLRQVLLTSSLVLVATVGNGDQDKPTAVAQDFIEPNFGHSGAWYNPEHPGQGFFFDINPELSLAWISWFTFKEAGPEDESVIGYPDNRWFVAMGTYSPGENEVTLTILETDGGSFDDSAPVTESEIGSIMLRFISCSEVELNFLFDESGLEGQIPLQRLTSTGVCEAYLAAR
jgi:hypothetical protein